MLELLIVIGIAVILAALFLPLITKLRTRAQRVQCTMNLRNLHIAAAQYVQDNNHWPQIARSAEDEDHTDYTQQWIAALAPYNLTKKGWICPTIQSLLGNPDYNSLGNERVDYLAMPFDDKPITPYQWPRQPWFVEAGNVHGNGQLIIFTDGSISDFKTVLAEAKH